mgnify:CR=1 FL=1|jgi:hypothetical protein
MGKTAIQLGRNQMMAALIITDVTCWSGLIFLAFKWATCTCGA